jgi:hypothetical protein
MTGSKNMFIAVVRNTTAFVRFAIPPDAASAMVKCPPSRKPAFPLPLHLSGPDWGRLHHALVPRLRGGGCARLRPGGVRDDQPVQPVVLAHGRSRPNGARNGGHLLLDRGQELPPVHERPPRQVGYFPGPRFLGLVWSLKSATASRQIE